MKKYQTTLKLADKTTLGITIFSTESSNVLTLILYPAFGIKATYYAKFAQQLAATGINVITTDLRGHGLSSVRPNANNNYGFLEMVSDLKAVADFTKEKFSNQKIYLLGHSLGGQAASLAVAKYPKLVDGLIIIGSPNVHYKNWSGFHYYRRKIGLHLLPMIGKIVSVLPKFKIGGYYVTQKQMREWGYTGQTGNYKAIGDDFDYEKGFKAVKLPLLSIFIEGDGMAPKKAMENLFGKFKKAAVTDLTLTHAMAGQSVSHINWPRTATKAMLEIVKDWLREQEKTT